jgi:hypothetical protein
MEEPDGQTESRLQTEKNKTETSEWASKADYRN